MRRVLIDGFTLTELVVVIGIMSLFFALFAGGYISFRDELAMSQYAQGIASAFRKAESNSIIAAAASYTGPETFPDGYGVYANTGNPHQLTFFLDGPNLAHKLRYEPTDPTELVQTIALPSEIRVMSVHEYDSLGNEITRGPLSFLFLRPDPTLKVYDYDSGAQLTAAHYGIRLQVSSGSTRTIHVWSTGQIYVSKP